MADAGQVVLPLAASCLLNALHVCASFLLACPVPHLHLGALPANHLPDDLRLYDYSWRYRLHHTCFVSLIRAVHAARHVAYHYDTWHTQTGSSNVVEFTEHVFGGNASADEVHQMIRDGHRLGWLETECQSSYVGFIVVLDWTRFQATSDAHLLRSMHDVLGVPAARSLLMLLEPQWPWQSFSSYHGKLLHHHSQRQTHADRSEQVAQFALAGTMEKETLIRPLFRTCDGCTLFESPSTMDPLSCSACPRGGFVCQGRGHELVGPCPTSEFLTCAIELLRRSLSTCRQIDRPREIVVGSEAGHDREGTPPADLDSALSVGWSQLRLRCNNLPLQLQMLELVLSLDQRLEHLLRRHQRHQQQHREDPSQAMIISPPDEHRRTSAASRSRSSRRSGTTLERVEEEQEEQSGK